MEIRGGHDGYLIVFYANGGSCDVFSAYTNASGKLDSLPVPAKAGGTFLGWYTESGEQITTETVFAEDAVAVAEWKIVLVTITGAGDTSGWQKVYLTMPDGKVITGAGLYQVAAGDVIKCTIYSEGSGGISVNNTSIVTVNENSGRYKYHTYEYTATKDVEISLFCNASVASVTITES